MCPEGRKEVGKLIQGLEGLDLLPTSSKGSLHGCEGFCTLLYGNLSLPPRALSAGVASWQKGVVKGCALSS